jgi:hypothetical protein
MPEELRIGRAGPKLLVEWRRFGRLTASESRRETTFTPVPDVDATALQKFRATELIACRRYLLGELSLHGSAVRFPAGALALVGESGAGKSTTAMAAVERFGGEFLADDIVPVDWQEEVPMVSPVDDHHWLTAQSAAHFGVSSSHAWKAPCAPRARAAKPERLVAIVHLVFDDAAPGVSVEPLSGQEAFLALSQVHVCYSTFEDDDTIRNLTFRADLARGTRMFRLRRPRSLDLLERVVDALQACLQASSRTEMAR